MYWIERNNSDMCAVNATGLTVEEYMEVTNGYTWYATNGMVSFVKMQRVITSLIGWLEVCT